MTIRALVKTLLSIENRELEVKTFSCVCDCEHCLDCHYDDLKDEGDTEVDCDGRYFAPINSVGMDTYNNGEQVVILGG